MRFELLDWSGAERPRFSFAATGPGEFAAAIAGFSPHDTSEAMQFRRWGNSSIRRHPRVRSWHYTVAAHFPVYPLRPWCLFCVPERPGFFVETMVGLDGVREARSVWPEIVEAVAALDDWLRQLAGLAAFAAESPISKPRLRLVGDRDGCA